MHGKLIYLAIPDYANIQKKVNRVKHSNMYKKIIINNSVWFESNKTLSNNSVW